ncbi:MAG: glutamate-5-semialdehyde dehydrogenase [Ruthenibacterium lactatiformans]
MTTADLLCAARAVKPAAAALSTAEKNRLLEAMAQALLDHADNILAANAADVEAARGVIAPVMIDRLSLSPARVESMAEGMRAVAALPDPVGELLSETARPNGLVIRKVRVPMGVIAIIYESRPNVTADAAALCLKSGNVCVLRGGKEAIRSNTAVVAALRAGLEHCGAPGTLVNLVRIPPRQCRPPDGGPRLCGPADPLGRQGPHPRCVDSARCPASKQARVSPYLCGCRGRPAKAPDIVYNAKTSRPSVCNAAEGCLVHRDVAEAFLPALAARLAGKQVELRLCPRSAAVIPGTPAGPEDFDTEFLDYILAVKVVDSVQDAAAHIAAHSTGHSEAITEDAVATHSAQPWIRPPHERLHALTDGGELGCEMGISTQKLGARGPMGLAELTSYKYIIRGNGQVR